MSKTWHVTMHDQESGENHTVSVTAHSRDEAERSALNRWGRTHAVVTATQGESA